MLKTILTHLAQHSIPKPPENVTKPSERNGTLG